MVKKLFSLYRNLVHKEINSLNQAALFLGLFSLLSQFVGFLRDRLLAHIFGAGAELDVYYSAFRIPDFIFVSVASVVSLSVLVPFILERDKQGLGELKRFINSIFTYFSVMILAVAGVAFYFMPQLSKWLFTGASESFLGQVIFISRILLLSPILLGFSNLLGSLTQAYNRFIVYAFAPGLYNAGIIVGIILFHKEWGILGAVFGVIIGAVLHILIQLPSVAHLGVVPKLTFRPNWREFVRVMQISLPRTLTLAMSAIVFIFLTAMATRLTSGSVSILNFSNNLQTISLSLIGVSYSLAAFPTLTRKFQENNIKAFIEQMQISSRFIIFWSLPLTALLIVLRAQIVRTLLGSGMFDWQATRLTAAALALFSISALFQSMLLLWMRGFYSAGHTKKPFYINLFSSAILIAITYWLIACFNNYPIFAYFILAILKVGDLAGGEMLMIPLGFSLGTILNGLLLWLAFELEFKGYTRGILRTLFAGFASAVIMGFVAHWGLELFDGILDLDTLMGVFLQGFLAGLLAILAGVLLLILLKSEELASVWDSLRAKFWKSRVIATDPEIV